MEKKLDTGTTTLGIKGKDFVVLAADKRVTAGNYMPHDDFTKIVDVAPGIAVTVAGMVSEVQLISKYLRSELKLTSMRSRRNVSVKETANLLANWTYGAIRTRGGVAHFIVGGFDDKPVLFDVSPDGSIFEAGNFVTSGSGSLHAISVLDTQYSKDITEEKALELAKEAIVAAMTRDNASGHGYSLWLINKDGIAKKIDKKLERVFK